MPHPQGPFKVRKLKGSLAIGRWHIIDTRKGNDLNASVDCRATKEAAQEIADQKNFALLVLKGLPA